MIRPMSTKTGPILTKLAKFEKVGQSWPKLPKCWQDMTVIRTTIDPADVSKHRSECGQNAENVGQVE